MRVAREKYSTLMSGLAMYITIHSMQYAVIESYTQVSPAHPPDNMLRACERYNWIYVYIEI